MKSPLQKPRQIRRFLCNRPDGPLKASRRPAAVRTPRSVLQINIEDVWTSKEHRPDARSISIQPGVCFQKSTLFGKFVQFVRTMSSLCKTSGRLGNMSGRYPVIQITPEFRLNVGRILVKTVWTLGQAVRTQTR
jgi:hypothetical protein